MIFKEFAISLLPLLPSADIFSRKSYSFHSEEFDNGTNPFVVHLGTLQASKVFQDVGIPA
jgi:hypothetical protein